MPGRPQDGDSVIRVRGMSDLLVYRAKCCNPIRGENIVGCGGAEAYSVAALVRSIAVLPDYRKQGLGRRLVRQLLDRLSAHGLREFYLLTTTAETYFQKRGFKTIDRDEVHPQLLASREFQDACPDSAVCMRLVMH